MVQPRMSQQLKDAAAEWISSPLLVPPSPYSVCIYWILSPCPEDENVSKKGGQEHIWRPSGHFKVLSKLVDLKAPWFHRLPVENYWEKPLLLLIRNMLQRLFED